MRRICFYQEIFLIHIQVRSLYLFGFFVYKLLPAMFKSYKYAICILSLFFCHVKANAQQFQKFPITRDYYGHLLYTPPSYDERPEQSFPLLIAFHGVGEGGDGSSADLEKLKTTGIPSLISRGQWPAERPFIVLCPQSAQGFMSPSIIKKTVDRIINTYRVDVNRVYITGYSAGAMTLWKDLNEHYKDIAAAVVPISGNKVKAYPICEVKDVPIWAFHGGSDSNAPTAPRYSIENVEDINACNPPPAQRAKVTIFPGVGHNAWDITYNLAGMKRNTQYDAYDVDIYTWMLQYSKKKEGISISNFQASSSSFYNNVEQTIRFTAIISSGNPVAEVSINLTTIGGSANHQMDYSGGQYVLDYKTSAGLSVGNKFISVTARDNAGNETTKSLMLLVEEDNSIESPTDLETSPVNTEEIRLNWIDRSDNEAGFVVEYRKSNESTYRVLGSVNENITTYSATGLDCSATFFFRVKAVNDNNSSEYTNVASASPRNLAAPAIVVDGELSFCEGGNVELSSETDNEEYLWSNGATTKSIIASASGAYSLKVKDRNNCWSSNSESVQVVVHSIPSKPEIIMNGNGTICPGNSVELKAPAGHDEYLWSNGATAQTIQVNEPGEYAISVADNGCWSEESDDAVVLDKSDAPKPVISYSGTNEFCDGESTLLEAPAGYNYYLWSEGRTTRTIEVKESGSYTVQVAHCPDEWSETSDAVSLTFHDLPAEPVIVAHGDTEFCEGESLLLTVSDGYTQYQWNNHASTTHEAEITSSGEYSARVKNEEGCWSSYSNTVNVTVQAKPVQPEVVYAGTPVICPGQGFELSAPEGHDEYLWSNGAASRTITALEEGAFSVSVADNGCWSDESEPASVAERSDPPKPTLSFTGDREFCDGESATLTAPARFNYYLWSDGSRSRNLEVTKTGSYSVQVANCPDEWSEPSNDISLLFHESPGKPVVNATGKTEICEGENVSLTTDSGFAEYDWQNHSSLTATAIVSKTGSYSVRVLNEGGCWSGYSDAVSVIVNSNPEQPEVTYEGEPVICPGQGFRLTASGSYDDYLWSNGATTQTIVVTQPGEYSVAAANKGCWSAESQPAVVEDKSETPKPVISYGGETEFCDGKSVLLTAPAGYNYYSWSDGRTQGDIQVGESGTYSVRVAYCPGEWSEPSEGIQITVNPTPEAPVIDLEGSDYCVGEKALLSVPANFEAYLWSNGANSASVAVEKPGNYVVRVKNQYDCWSDYSDPVKIAFREMATPKIVVNGDTDLCEGDRLTLKTAGAYNKYLWSNGEIQSSIAVEDAGTYSVQVSNCHSEVWSDPSEVVEVTVRKIDEPVIMMEDNVLSTTEYDAYQWLYNGSPILGATSSYYAPSKSGDYAVQVYNEYGCSRIATTLAYTYENQEIVVYPNPSSGRFILKLLNPDLQEGSIIINSLENKNLAYLKEFRRTADSTIEFDLSHFDTGFYILILKSNDRNIQGKLIIH